MPNIVENIRQKFDREATPIVKVPEIFAPILKRHPFAVLNISIVLVHIQLHNRVAKNEGCILCFRDTCAWKNTRCEAISNDALCIAAKVGALSVVDGQNSQEFMNVTKSRKEQRRHFAARCGTGGTAAC